MNILRVYYLWFLIVSNLENGIGDIIEFLGKVGGLG